MHVDVKKMLSRSLLNPVYSSLFRHHQLSSNGRSPKESVVVSVLYGSHSGTSQVAAERFYNDLISELSCEGTKAVLDPISDENKKTCNLGRCRLLFAPVTTVEFLLTQDLSGDCSEEDSEVYVQGGQPGVSCHRHLTILFLSTYTDGSPPTSAKTFYEDLREHVYDFRVEKNVMCSVEFAVMAFGSTAYSSPGTDGSTSCGASHLSTPSGNYCLAGKNVDEWLMRLGGHRLAPLFCCTDTMDIPSQLQPVTLRLRRLVQERVGISVQRFSNPQISCCNTELSINGNAPCKEKISKREVKGGVAVSSESGDEDQALDLEDTGLFGVSDLSKTEMVTTRQRQQLQKEGYKLLGSHSAVKLCRWTKAQLRGRGGCYKHTFYGITSYQCMELTPSLACANKCVFCWRHHKNPVGKSWKWKTDEPRAIVDEGISEHVKMMKELKGVPGVIAERFQEAQTVRHCALSLVGEPIMYPRINELIDLLHSKHISTFLVTNGQFPEAIRSLRPVTQLYVSIDAADKLSLQNIDRPLFSDFWERLLESIDALRAKRQRTVYRLTLVKKYNMDEALAYAELVRRGLPDFIEIKAVTYCGTSPGSDITMEHIPWHEEVIEFGQAICSSLADIRDEYELASEHRHSCCIVLARRRFKDAEGRWLTWVDYNKFHQLASGKEVFDSLDYSSPTPSWAVFGSIERGFDPVEQRVYTKGKFKDKKTSADAARKT
eukprot:GHVQ01035260.1.p1 GENE.GHVQ01035260.1~~GHVQ01035260.1.p1  ORF type:complete len:716 (-),score=78.56 GHVQ01035260.1:2117-4264(-)